MQKKRYLLKYYYIGQRYYGSQRQKKYRTIEKSILNALKIRNYIQDQKSSKCEFASRTDRHVSARGAAFSFISEKKPIIMEINTALPNDIGIWAYTTVPLDFLSRFNAVFRHYKYIYYRSSEKQLNLELLRDVCHELIGNHDFVNFSKRDKEEQLTKRDMISVEMSEHENFIIFDFKSRAFLRQQIRRIVKKLIEVGAGEISYNDFLELLECEKEVSYQPIDPFGLILWDIKYGDELQFEIDKKSYSRMMDYFKDKHSYYNKKQMLFNIMQEDYLG